MSPFMLSFFWLLALLPIFLNWTPKSEAKSYHQIIESFNSLSGLNKVRRLVFLWMENFITGQDVFFCWKETVHFWKLDLQKINFEEKNMFRKYTFRSNTSEITLSESTILKNTLLEIHF